MSIDNILSIGFPQAPSATAVNVCPVRTQRSWESRLRTASNTLSFMTIQSGRTARQLCAAADEALTEAAFRTGGFAEAEGLFGEARTLAERDGDREAEAFALGGLGMAHHYRNIANLVSGRAPTDADVAAEEGLMLRALAIWQEIGDAAGTARALAALGEAEMAAGDLQRAVELLSRAVAAARDADLLPWWIPDAEESLRKAEAALSAAS